MNEQKAEQRRTNPEWLAKAFYEYREAVFAEALRVPVGTWQSWLLDLEYDEQHDGGGGSWSTVG